jgi:hypothetical protein
LPAEHELVIAKQARRERHNRHRPPGQTVDDWELERPHAIREQRKRGAADQDQPQDLWRVGPKHTAAGAGSVRSAGQLGLSLAGGHEHGSGRDHQQEPQRQPYRRRHPACDRTQHEPARDGQQVEDRDPAPDQRVAQRQPDIRRPHDEERRSDHDAHREPREYQRQPQRRRRARVELPGSDRPQPLAWMTTILLGVVNVVDRVDPRGEQAERQARKRHPDGDIVVTQRAGCAGGGDHERVLDPLPGANGREHGLQRIAPRAGSRSTCFHPRGHGMDASSSHGVQSMRKFSTSL